MTNKQFQFIASRLLFGSYEVIPKVRIRMSPKMIWWDLKEPVLSFDNTKISIEKMKVSQCFAHIGSTITLMLFVDPKYSVIDATSPEEGVKQTNNVITIELRYTSNYVRNKFKQYIPHHVAISEEDVKKMMKKYTRPSKVYSDIPNNKTCILTYPWNAICDVPITVKEYKQLAFDKPISYSIFFYYMEYLLNEVLTKSQRNVTTIFDTKIFNKLVEKPSQSTDGKSEAKQRYLRVKTWTEKMNIFEADFIFIPIHEDGRHWSLAIICYPGLIATSSAATKRPCILFFDPKFSKERLDYYNETFTIIRDFLSFEFENKCGAKSIYGFNKITMPGRMMKVPQQMNPSDSGLFVLQYIEKFYKVYQKCKVPTRGRKKWFAVYVATRKRGDIVKLIKKHMTEHNEKTDFPVEELPHTPYDMEYYLDSIRSLFQLPTDCDNIVHKLY